MTTYTCADATSLSAAMAKAVPGDTICAVGKVAQPTNPAAGLRGVTLDLSQAVLNAWRLTRLYDVTILAPNLLPLTQRGAALEISGSDGVSVVKPNGRGMLAQGGLDPGGVGVLVLTSNNVTVTGGRFDGLYTGVLAKDVTSFTVESCDFYRTGEDSIGIGGSVKTRLRNLRVIDPRTIPGIHGDGIQFKDATVNTDIEVDHVYVEGAIQGLQTKDPVDLTVSNFIYRGSMGGAVNFARGVRVLLRNVDLGTLPGSVAQAHLDDREADVRYEGDVWSRAFGTSPERWWSRAA